MARLILSAGIFSDLAARIAVRRRGLESGSPPLMRAATEISLMILVKIFPRRASAAPFLCLMVAHLEWPDIKKPSFQFRRLACIGNPFRAGVQGCETAGNAAKMVTQARSRKLLARASWVGSTAGRSLCSDVV